MGHGFQKCKNFGGEAILLNAGAGASIPKDEGGEGRPHPFRAVL
jgi:hypothetical protein